MKSTNKALFLLFLLLVFCRADILAQLVTSDRFQFSEYSAEVNTNRFNTSSKTVISIDENKEKSHQTIKIFNNSNSMVILTDQISEITITDMYGKILFQLISNCFFVQLDMGIYQIEILNKDEISRKQVFLM